MTNNLRFIGVNTLKNISDAIREKIGIKDPMTPGKWEETLMPYNYDRLDFDQNAVHYCRAISLTENFTNNQSIMFLTGNSILDTGSRTSMVNMFRNCTNLFGTPGCDPNVTNMDYAYYNCCNLTGSPVCGPKVTNMEHTYDNCHNLTGSPVCGPKVTNMYYSYARCYNLTGSPVCGSNVTNMSEAYSNCHNLTGSPVCGPNVNNMAYTYDNCSNLTGSPVCGPNVTNMAIAYASCYNLTGSPVFGPNVTYASATFFNCHNLYKTGYLDCPMNCVYRRVFDGAFNKMTPFELVIGANVNFYNINSNSFFGVSGDTINQESGPNGVTIDIHTAYPENGVSYIKRVKGDRIGSYGLINIYRENNIS